MQTAVGLRQVPSKSRAQASLLWPDGTLATPGGAFANDRDNGVHRLGADEWALVAGGAAPLGGPALRMRVGPKHVQVGMGQMGSPTAWAWGAVNPGTVVHIQRNEPSPTGGDTQGLVSSVTSAASSGGAGGLPDGSGISTFFVQSTAGHDGAGRALEAHAARTATGSGSVNASLYAAELAISTIVGGNGTDKIGGIHMLSVDDTAAPGPALGVRCDVGAWIRGSMGYTHPLRIQDETTLAQGILCDVDFQGKLINYGGLEVTGPARLIQGSWDVTVAPANRTKLQTRTINQITAVPIVPNGNATAAQLEVYNRNDPTNAGMIQTYIDNSAAVLISSKTGTGTQLPLEFQVNAIRPLSLQTNGDVLIGAGGLTPGVNAGFQFIQTVASQPTGTPNAYAGRTAMVYDLGAHKLWVRDGASWRGVVLT